MRQIPICAWLFALPLVVAACGGDRFTSSSEAGATPQTPPTASGGSSSMSSSSDGKSSGTNAPGDGGKSAKGGTSTGGQMNASGGNAPAPWLGGVSSGGDGGTGGGSNGAGGASDADCPSGAITFRMLPSPDLGADYLCDAGCGTGWLTITDAEGATAFSIFSACGTASCESCETLACAVAACLPTPLSAEGSELVWTGTYLAKGTCGANMACQRQTCVKPGKFKAKACAALNGGPSSNGGACTPQSDQLCAEAEFEFPATKTVKLVLQNH